ncbi:MAG: mannose-6-phosphate isomerase [Chloroflexi bacterium]|nr:mannose-6-phosphate isomerase [Chloroflexota bacterium]
MSNNLYPLLFEPVLKDYIWGGRNLEKLGRKLPLKGVIAESWEISGHKDGTTRVANGRFAGLRLTELQEKLRLDLIGTRSAWAQERGKFPLLIKLLDANRPLSVQVHPDDDYALANEGNELGKTEMWVVLQATPDAEVILGVAANTTPELFRAAIAAGNLAPHLHRIRVKIGDPICVPAGSLHAIMGGLLIAEIQQNSNTTYRVYDWNRMGADGNPRPLHVNKAMDVINFEQIAPQICAPEPIISENGVSRSLLCQTDYFVTERVKMAAGATFQGNCTGETLEIWGVTAGEVAVNGLALTAVNFTLLPAALGEFVVTAVSPATLLRSYVA